MWNFQLGSSWSQWLGLREIRWGGKSRDGRNCELVCEPESFEWKSMSHRLSASWQVSQDHIHILLSHPTLTSYFHILLPLPHSHPASLRESRQRPWPLVKMEPMYTRESWQPTGYNPLFHFPLGPWKIGQCFFRPLFGWWEFCQRAKALSCYSGIAFKLQLKPLHKFIIGWTGKHRVSSSSIRAARKTKLELQFCIIPPKITPVPVVIHIIFAHFETFRRLPNWKMLQIFAD